MQNSSCWLYMLFYVLVCAMYLLPIVGLPAKIVLVAWKSLEQTWCLENWLIKQMYACAVCM